MNQNDAAFDLCFSAMQASLASVVSKNPSVSSFSKEDVKKEEQVRQKMEAAVSAEVRMSLLTSAAGRLSTLRAQRDIALQRLATDLDSKHANLATIQMCQQKELESCLSQKLMSSRRLTQQVLTAERRIRELVFEIIGEYGKSDIRFRRRQSYLSYTARIHVAWVCYKNAWDRFALRLCHEATRLSEEDAKKMSSTAGDGKAAVPQFDTIRAVVLDSITHAEEIAAVEAKLTSKLRAANGAANVGEGGTRVLTALRLLKSRTGTGNSSSGGSSGSQNSSFRVQVPFVIDTVQELSKVPQALRVWAARALRASNVASSKDKPGPLKGKETASRPGRAAARPSPVSEDPQVVPDFLRSGCIDWLNPPTHSPEIWDLLMSIRGTHTPSVTAFSTAGAVDTSAAQEGDMESESRKKLTPALESFIERYSIHHGAFVASERLYYCLEERRATSGARPQANPAGPDGAFDGLLRRIDTHYAREVDAGLTPLRELLEQRPMDVQEYLGSHRDLEGTRDEHLEVASLSSVYPDVVLTRTVSDNGGDSLHFAAATTFNLLETQAFADIVASNPPDTQRLRTIAQRGAHPPDLIQTVTDPSFPSDDNIGASEADNSAQLRLNMERTVPLGRLYCLVRIAIDIDRNESKSGPGVRKEKEKKEKKFKRTASNRYVSHKRTKNKSENKNADDSSEDEEDIDADDRSSPTKYDARDEIAAPSPKVSRLIMLPISDLCMREIVRSEFWADDAFKADTAAEDAEKKSGRRKSLTRGSAPVASFANLLPDHVRLCLCPYAEVTPDFHTLQLNHRYVLMSDEYREAQDEESKEPVPEARQCYYFLQLEGGCEFPPRKPTNAYGDISSLHREDEGFLLGILQARRAGFGLPSNTSNASEQSNNGRSRSLTRKAKETANAATADDEDLGKGKRKWDATILSTVCRWRSCLAECAPDSKPIYLCPFHTSLYLLLEGSSKGGSGEAAKYLPKKVPLLMSSSTLSDSKKDLLMIRAASTLLQELWDGKLRATVRSFTKKVSHDMGLRHRLEASMSLTSTFWEAAKDGKEGKEGKDKKGKDKDVTTPIIDRYRKGVSSQSNSSSQSSVSAAEIERALSVPLSPSWTRWKNEDALKRTTSGQVTYTAALEGILGTETAISDELKRLMDMHVFPAQELTIIKKEVKAFKEGFESAISSDAASVCSAVYGECTAGPGNKTQSAKAAEEYAAMIVAEAKICDRKFNMLRSRRVEEQETRQAAARRNARARAVEEVQAKDPANFSQQRF